MKNDPEIGDYEAALREIFSQLSRKYSVQRVLRMWEKIKEAGEGEFYFGICGCKPGMAVDDHERKRSYKCSAG